MKRLVLLVGLMLTSSLWGSSIAALGANAKTVLVLGDSISAAYGIQREAGWVALLAARLAAERPGDVVVNASISGETTEGALARLPAALAKHAPDIVVLELGGNDALRGYPVDRIEANIEAMTALVANAGARVVLVGMQIPPNYGPRYANAFKALYEDVARREQLAFVPFPMLDFAADPDMMQADGIHPTAAAQGKILEHVLAVLSPLL